MLDVFLSFVIIIILNFANFFILKNEKKILKII